jgi:hypothetical protein
MNTKNIKPTNSDSSLTSLLNLTRPRVLRESLNTIGLTQPQVLRYMRESGERTCNSRTRRSKSSQRSRPIGSVFCDHHPHWTFVSSPPLPHPNWLIWGQLHQHQLPTIQFHICLLFFFFFLLYVECKV